VNVSCWDAKFGFVGKVKTFLIVINRNKYVKLNGLLIEWENITKRNEKCDFSGEIVYALSKKNKIK